MMRQSPGPPRSGFVPDGGGPPPPNLPLKTGIWHRARPELTLAIDAWFLPPQMLREIVSNLRQQARLAERARHFAERDQLDDTAAAIDDFIRQRRLYGEGARAWP